MFEKLGGKVVAAEAVAPTDVDMRPMLTGVATAKPCVIYFPVFTAAAAQIVRQAPDISGLENTNIIAGNVALSVGFLQAAGQAAVGTRLTTVDADASTMGGSYPALLTRYKDKYGENPPQPFHANAYDAGTIVGMAIETVAKKDDKGNTLQPRQKKLEEQNHDELKSSFLANGILYDKEVMVVEQRADGELELQSGFNRLYVLLHELGIDTWFVDVVTYTDPFFKALWKRRFNATVNHLSLIHI